MSTKNTISTNTTSAHSDDLLNGDDVVTLCFCVVVVLFFVFNFFLFGACLQVTLVSVMGESEDQDQQSLLPSTITQNQLKRKEPETSLVC
jgi:hypothetical protein